MTMDRRALLHELATATAPGQNVTVPREWLLEVLGDMETHDHPSPAPAAIVPGLLTVHQAAARLEVSVAHLYHRA